jgi:hypothetical protein
VTAEEILIMIKVNAARVEAMLKQKKKKKKINRFDPN